MNEHIANSKQVRRRMQIWLWLRRHHVAILLTAVAVKQILFIWLMPPWQPPDEPAHFQYTQTIIEERRFPVFAINRRLYSQEVIDSFENTGKHLRQRNNARISLAHDENEPGLNPRHTASDSKAPTNYAAPYSPLYYLLEGLPYLAFYQQSIEMRLTAMRIFSSIWLLVIVWLAYHIARRLRHGTGPAMTVATMVGFFPMLGINAAGVNNDIVLICLVTAVFYKISGWLKQQPNTKDIVITGFIAGLAAMTKQQGWIAVAIAAGGLWMVIRRLPFRTMITKMTALLVPAFVVGLSWVVRGMLVNATNFISGEFARPSSAQTEFFSPFWILIFDLSIRVMQIWVTAWGYFGVGGRYPHFLYGVFAAIAAFAVIGLIFLFRSRTEKNIWRTWLSIGILGYIVSEVLFQILYWQRALTLHVVTFPNQGRYYFMLIVPFMALLLAGIEYLFEAKRRPWVWVGLAGLMILLSVWSMPIMSYEYAGLH